MYSWVNKLYEENSKLLGNRYDVPEDILEFLKISLDKHKDNTTAKGYKRANFICKNPNQPFVNLVRIKNYFDNVDPDNLNQVEYELNGGDMMNNWVQNLIKSERDRVEGNKVARTNAGMDNQFRKDSEGGDFDTSVGDRIMDTPDIMTNSALMESINKIKNIINKI